MIQRCAQLSSSLLLAWAVLSLIGCGPKAPDVAAHDQAIRARYAEFIKVLFAENYPACVALTDPASVQTKGAEAVTGAFKQLGTLIKGANLKVEDVRIDSVVFNDDCTTVQVQTSLSMKGEWKKQTPSQWIRNQGQWFLVPGL